jgi:hypothetical protein
MTAAGKQNASSHGKSRAPVAIIARNANTDVGNTAGGTRYTRKIAAFRNGKRPQIGNNSC